MKLLASASDLSSDLSSEVLFLLLDALTLDVVDSIDEGSLAAQLLGSVGNVASNITLEQVGTDEVLLQQADIIEPTAFLLSLITSRLTLSHIFLICLFLPS